MNFSIAKQKPGVPYDLPVILIESNDIIRC